MTNDRAREFLSERELVKVLQVTGYYRSFGRVSTGYGSEPVVDIADGSAS